MATSPSVADLLHPLSPEEQQLRQSFYATLDESIKAEWINGEMIIHSPVRLQHSDASLQLAFLINLYLQLHPLGKVFHETVLVQLTRNAHEPDICFFNAARAAAFTPHTIIFPAPDFIAEVLSQSTAERDRGVKFEDYAAHGVREYWIIDPEQQHIEQYVLHAGHYQLQLSAADGDIESRVINGLRMPIRAVFDATIRRATIHAMVAQASA